MDTEQSELTALEKGKHAYDHIQLVGKGKGGTDSQGEGIEEGLNLYSRNHHLPNSSVDRWYKAYKVYSEVSQSGKLDLNSVNILYEISKTPEEAWGALCECAEKEGWTVLVVRQHIVSLSLTLILTTFQHTWTHNT